ncbi:uncharacterized protein LOC122425624 isoform X1 [Cervus canadensis]|uniref:uncharacterized protein LOC122425624 isoform X1 n=1 Tax=Cervus canadensis TaxID=1574408 RepID=UPI001C9E36D0|nr:uncharacterized protein LOC122425624 isoform X1 [Cervus canadensis]
MTTGGHGEVAIRRPRRSLATPDLGLPASRTSGTLVFIHPVYGVRCARRLEGWETLAANSAPLVPTDGADFSGTSNVPDVARTGTWGNLADRNPRAAPASPTPRRAAQDPDQETRRKAGCWTLDGPRRRRGEPAHLAGGENRVSSLPRVPSETTRGTEREPRSTSYDKPKWKRTWKRMCNPGGPVVKNLLGKARGTSSIPGPGRKTCRRAN